MKTRTGQCGKKQDRHTLSQVTRATGLLISSIVFSVPLSAVAGESIVYPGDALDTVNGVVNSLAPSGSNTGKSNSLSGNSVTVNSGGNVGGSVYGAINVNDADGLIGNAVIINTGSTISASIYGGQSFLGDVTDNTVDIIGATASQNVFGGWSNNGVANNNTVTIGGSSLVQWDVYGGYSRLSDVMNNTVDISGGTVQQNVYGGVSDGNGVVASGNIVNISGGLVEWSVYGGYSLVGSATNNTVTSSGGLVNGNVYGGFIANLGTATDNSVVLSGISVGSSVYGGYSSSGDIINNNVVLSSSTIGNDVYGGYSSTSDAIGNAVILSGGSIGNDVYGGYSGTLGSVTNNTVAINTGTQVGRNVYGGYSDIFGLVADNTVTLSGASIALSVYGGRSFLGDVTGNSVTVSSGVVGEGIYGGYSRTGNVTSNTVTLNNGISINGEVFGASSEDGDATGNSVTIDGGATLRSNVYGAWSTHGDASGNIVILSDATVEGSIFGGGSSSSSNVTGNTVTLGNGSSVGSDIYGGLSYGGDAFSSNTLNVKAADLSVGGDLKNFEYLNFYLPSTAAANTTMLKVAGEADLTNGAGGSSTVNVGIAGGSSPLKMGDSITLIQAGTLTTNSGLNTTADGKGMQGISLLYEFDIVADTANNKLLARVASGPVVNPQTKVLSEGRIAGLGFVTQGADLLTGSAMQTVLNDASHGTNLFGVMQGSSVRHDTGSHVDVDGMNLTVGVLKRNAFNSDPLTVGAFVEAGWGNYDSYSSFTNAFVHGDGDTSYYGAGLMGRLDISNGFYADSSVRIGQVETDFKAYISGLPASYDRKSTYYGVSLGGGKVLSLDEQKNVDLYARYLWTRIGSDSVIVVGDQFNFDAMNSHRLRAGVRYTNQFKSNSSFYAGAVYEYEFDGDAKGSVHGLPLHTPSLQGGTGVFELGMTFRPQSHDRLSINAGLQGYVGQREGVSGTVKINYAF